VRLVITQDNEVIAEVADYTGPVPRAGEYVHHPRGRQPQTGLLDHFMTVKLVAWGIIARPDDESAGHFTGAAEPFVEVVV
jgi:hypothetical protein